MGYEDYTKVVSSRPKLGNYYLTRTFRNVTHRHIDGRSDGTFDCHCVGKIIVPLFVYVALPPLSSK